MATFTNKTFAKDDDWITPKSAWKQIKHIIPKDKVIWESFYCDGKSGTHLKELGFDVIHENIDFFENDLGDIIITNPPFSIVKKIMPYLLKLDKPFILLMPVSKIGTQYMKIFKEKLQIVIPPNRIKFEKKSRTDSSPNFDCFYYCYKINLKDDITWL
jgi:hypothetical protein